MVFILITTIICCNDSISSLLYSYDIFLPFFLKKNKNLANMAKQKILKKEKLSSKKLDNIVYIKLIS